MPPIRNNQQFARQLEAKVLRDRLLAAGWPEEAFNYPTFVRRCCCSERQCGAYKSAIGEIARQFGLRQAERVFKCHSTTALFFRDKLERVDDKDAFEIPTDLVEQTQEAVRVAQSRLPSTPPPDPLLARLQEQFEQLVAQQQERHEKEMRQLQEGQQKQQEQHERQMRELQELQRQQQEQHEKEMRKLQERLEYREKPPAPQETSLERVVIPPSEERRNAIEKFVQESCRAWLLMEQMVREGWDKTPSEPKMVHLEEGILFLQLPSLYQQWEGWTFGEKGLVGFYQCALYSLYNLEVLQQMERCNQLSKFLQDAVSTRSMPKEFVNARGIKGPLQKLVNRKQFCDYLQPVAKQHAMNVLNRLYLASSEEESDAGGLQHENLPFELSTADIYDLGEQQPPILDEHVRLNNLETYGGQYRDLEVNIQKLNSTPTFGFLLRYDIVDGQDKIPHYVAVLHVWVTRTRRACLVVDSLCGDTWKKALQQVLVALESPK